MTIVDERTMCVSQKVFCLRHYLLPAVTLLVRTQTCSTKLRINYLSDFYISKNKTFSHFPSLCSTDTCTCLCHGMGFFFCLFIYLLPYIINSFFPFCPHLSPTPDSNLWEHWFCLTCISNFTGSLSAQGGVGTLSMLLEWLSEPSLGSFAKLSTNPCAC